MHRLYASSCSILRSSHHTYGGGGWRVGICAAAVGRHVGPSSSSCACPSSSSSLGHGARWEARRFASTRRPTYTEIHDAVQALGFTTIDVDAKELKKRYRELVKRNHPDAGGDEAAMSRITVAYERLTSLSNYEKEEYRAQARMYQGASHYPTRGGGSGPYAQQRYAADPFRSSAQQQQQQGYGGGFYYQQDPQEAYAQQRAQQSAYWSYYNRHATGGSGGGVGGGGAFGQNPFSHRNPFSMFAQMQRARYMSGNGLLLRGLVLYLVCSMSFLLLYRSYRDWRKEDGWKMSESLARHEQLQEIQRIRQEMQDRRRAARGEEGMLGAVMPVEGRNMRVGESAELRALEYARQRRISMMEEQRAAQDLRGWPTLRDGQGRLVKRLQDPAGIVYYEPSPDAARQRQIDVQRESLYQQADASRNNNNGAATSQPPLPEDNVGAVFAAAVSNDAEVKSALGTIFQSLKKSDA